jgi:hypothetical protein
MSATCHSCAQEDANAPLPPPDRLIPVGRGGRRYPALLYSSRWFVRRQVLNASRYVDGLAAVQPSEFANQAAAPSGGHIKAANALLDELKQVLKQDVAQFAAAGDALIKSSRSGGFDHFLQIKDRIYAQSKEAERLLAFYRGIFQYRTGRFGAQLQAMDRIALDCYQAVWLGLGKARSIPAPAPFAYVEDGRGPATYRRGVKLSKLGRRPNPFPLVKIPQHRLHNPWTLGAVPHEVAHNLQNDLGLWNVLPKRIEAGMRGHLPEEAIRIWMRLHKESYADFAGTLLIGPAYVTSLIDVVGKRPEAAAAFNPEGVHPTPIIRVPMNCALLRRMGFVAEAQAFEDTWRRVYPDHLLNSLPAAYRKSLKRGMEAMVDICCYTKEAAYGGRALSEVIRFSQRDVGLVREAADRLLKGETTGVLPERFLIAAAQVAVRTRKATPRQVAKNFYQALGRT